LTRTELFQSLELDHRRRTSLRQQLNNELRRSVIEGRLRPGVKLPSSRRVAEELGIGRNTAIAAFEQLIAEGYLEARHGSGTFVVAALPEQSLLEHQLSSRGRTKISSRSRLSELGRWLARSSVPGLDPDRPPVPFRPSVAALDLFPQALWNRIRSRIARTLPTALYRYGNAAGYEPLRHVIADYLRASRGVRCDWRQVIVVSGAQQALDLAARVVLNAGDAAIVEDPGHPGAWAAFRAVGAKLIPFRVDKYGLAIDNHCSLPQARLACVCPSHQYPLGGTLPLRRRLTLLTWARQHRAWIIEDDYDSEFRYTGGPLPALQGLDQFNCVLYMGTFSKVLHPALRLGYLVVPNHLIDAFSTMKAIADRQAPLAEQAVLASFIEDGHFGRHIRRMRMVYIERQQILLEAAQDRLGGLLDVQPAEAGFHLVGWLPSGMKDTSVSDALQEAGIECPPLSRYTLRHRSRSGLMLGYAGYNKNELLSATAALATQMRSLNSRIVETEV